MKECSICGKEIDSWHIGGHKLNYHIECFKNISVLELIKESLEGRIEKIK